MNGRRLARWAVRATVIGALLTGAVYTASAANAEGAIWNLVPSKPAVEKTVEKDSLVVEVPEKRGDVTPR